MYAATAKNGEPINGIKAMNPASVVSVAPSRCHEGAVATRNHRFHDGTKSFRNFARRHVVAAE